MAISSSSTIARLPSTSPTMESIRPGRPAHRARHPGRPLPAQDLSDAIVVSPDFGNAKTATQFSRLLGLNVAAGSKRRLADDRVVIDSIVGDVHGKRAIVLDDEIATGGSIVELLDRLADTGCTGRPLACTHGLFVGKAVDRLRQHPMITEVVTTDTVPAPPAGRS